MDMRSKARRWKKTHDIQLIAIDYLQLMRSTSKRAQDNRQQEIAEISSGIKAIAKELSVPVIVLAQLNRNPESRTGKNVGKPKLSDLRESGSIEQDADIVGLLYRPEYYAADEEEKKADEGIAELLIAKHRNGPTGSVPLSFIKEYMRFELRARAEGEEAPD
jgi:replicative DNA helicase